MDNEIFKEWLHSSDKAIMNLELSKLDISYILESSLYAHRMRDLLECKLGLICIDKDRIFSKDPIIVDGEESDPVRMVDGVIKRIRGRFTNFITPYRELTVYYNRSNKIDPSTILIKPLKELIKSIYGLLPTSKQEVRRYIIDNKTNIYFVMGRYSIIVRRTKSSSLDESLEDDINLIAIDLGKTFYSVVIKKDITYSFGLPHIVNIDRTVGPYLVASNTEFARRYPNKSHGLKFYPKPNKVLTRDIFTISPVKIPPRHIAHPELVLDNNLWSEVATTFYLPKV